MTIHNTGDGITLYGYLKTKSAVGVWTCLTTFFILFLYSFENKYLFMPIFCLYHGMMKKLIED